MRIVFLSSGLNHHQLPFSLELLSCNDIEYTYIALNATPEERLRLGYEDMNNIYDFVVRAYESDEQKQRAVKLCEECDVLIVGKSTREYLKKRLRKGKLTFKYSERIFKEPLKRIELIPRFIKYYMQYGRYKNYYLLCASAYTAADYAHTNTFIGKAYRWGYFPPTKNYSSISELVSKKEKNSIIWVGRFLDWKHPESIFEIAKYLKENGYEFIFKVIGTGELEEQIKASVSKNGLEAYVKLLGPMSTEEVREHMENSEIFVFTSDRREGWGAVLNEAMNSGCAVVASHAIGSVPFLIEDTKNGIIYQDGNTDDLVEKVKYLFDNPKKREELAKNAYKTVTDIWNPKTAAQRLLQLINSINNSGNSDIFESGVCSKSPYLSDDWYKTR